jgi:hypothetical protein
LNRPFLFVATRVWLTEILVSGVNYYLLMKLIYEPLVGELTAHEIGMTTRIVYIFGFAYLLQRFNPDHSPRDLVHVGVLWLALTLAFEWGGSLLIQRRPVDEILQGWHVWEGYMWPFVLAAYFSANVIVGWALHPGLRAAGRGDHPA